MIVYLVGNDAVEGDSLPIQLESELKKVFPHTQFKKVDPTENFVPEKGSIILDTVQGIDTVQVFSDLTQFSDHAMISPHDYDLYFHLKLLQKLGKITHMTIIGLPMGKTVAEVKKDLISLLSLS